MMKNRTRYKEAKSPLCLFVDNTHNIPTSRTHSKKTTQQKKTRTNNRIQKHVLNKHKSKTQELQEKQCFVHDQKPKQQTQPKPTPTKQNKTNTRNKTNKTNQIKQRRIRNKEGLGSGEVALRARPPHLTLRLPNEKQRTKNPKSKKKRKTESKQKRKGAHLTRPSKPKQRRQNQPNRKTYWKTSILAHLQLNQVHKKYPQYKLN